MQQIQGYNIHELLKMLAPGFAEQEAERDCRPQRAWSSSTGMPSEWVPANEPGYIDPRDWIPWLRCYIDEWIDSGFLADGSESPHQRHFVARSCRDQWNMDDGLPNIYPAPNALSAVARYHHGTLMVQLLDPSSTQTGEVCGLYFIVEDESVQNMNNRIDIYVGTNGGLAYTPKFRLDDSTPETLAAGFFVGFFRSEWIHRLMRCNRCWALAAPERMPRKRYERGWHCPGCIRKASATVSTQITRAGVRERWMNLAAKAFADYEKRGIKSDCVLWIKDRVNNYLPAAQHIKRNSITRNLAEIQTRAHVLQADAAKENENVHV